MSAPLPKIVPARIAADDRIGEVVATLDRIGFDVGDTRISLWSALLAVIVILAVLVVARLGSALAKRVFGRSTRLDPTQRLLGEKLVSIAVWTLAILIGIDLLGIDLTALAFFSGAFGLAVGFGLQKTFGNLISGIILLMDRSIKPGDVIAVGDGNARNVGQVKKIGIRAVSVTTRDKKEYLIPNEILMTTPVENWSYSSREVRISIPVGVTYKADLKVAEELMLKAARAAKRVLDSPPPNVWLAEFSDSSVRFEIQVWIADPEEGLGNVRSEVLKNLWALFQENHIELPYLEREVFLRKPPEPTAGGAG